MLFQEWERMKIELNSPADLVVMAKQWYSSSIIMSTLQSFPDESGKYSVKYTSTPDKYNIILFFLNCFFHLLHLLNTHTTYDGTAADTSEASSQSKCYDW